MYNIDKIHWLECKICHKSLKDIKSEYGGKNCYFSQAFIDHIKSHGISPEHYFETICGLERPKCPCKRTKCGLPVNIKIQGAKILWRKYKCGFFEGTKEWSRKAKTERLGKNNPMFGHKPWNKDLTKDTDERIKKISEQSIGKVMPEESKLKMSVSAKKRKIHGHTGRKHSDRVKEIIRKNTLRMIKLGIFYNKKTKPHLALAKILDEINIKYEEERLVYPFSFDFYLIDYDLYIEVDGDYWHSNPKFYPNGPETTTQKINYSRDISKNKFCKINNLHLVRFWENDVLKNERYIIECIQKKLHKLDI